MKFNKHAEDNFTTVRNDVLQDRKLSWKAKGIFVYLWSQSDTWNYYQTEVAKHAKDGIDSLSSGIKELTERGYLRITRNRVKGQVKESIWDLYPSPTVFSPKPEKPRQVEPVQSNPTLTNTNSNKDLLKEDHSRKSKTYDEDSPYFVLANFLLTEMRKNNPDVKQPNIQKWSDDMRKLVEIDGRDKHDVSKVIRWCQKDDFWSTNILSASKLRKQYDQLFIKMTKEATKPNPLEPPMSDAAKQAADEAKQLAQQIEKEREVS